MSELRKAAKNILDYADWILKEQDTPPPCNLRNATESLRKALDQENPKPMRKLTSDGSCLRWYIQFLCRLGEDKPRPERRKG